jgi:glutaredoxin 3
MSGRNDCSLGYVESAMARVQMYTTRWCGYCVRAKALLDGRGIPYEEISLDDDAAFRRNLFELTGGWTVPQILIDGAPIGGFTELWRLDKSGALDARLAA